MNYRLQAVLAAASLVVATPVLAQAPPPAAGMRTQPPMHGEGGAGGGGGRFAARMRQRIATSLFAGMSPAGRQALAEAMRGAPGDRLAEREAVSAARDRMLTLLEADRMDTAALRRAMADERAAAEATHQRRQAALLAALQKLTPEDRKAFVANSRAAKNRMDDRLRAIRERSEPMDEMSPPMW
jgi:Spy/CpxP family protein refolding chaperone